MTASVFQVHPTVFDANHRADVAGFDILDDQTQFGGVFGRAGLASSRGQNIGSIAIHHAAILESLAAKQRYGAPRSADGRRNHSPRTRAGAQKKCV